MLSAWFTASKRACTPARRLRRTRATARELHRPGAAHGLAPRAGSRGGAVRAGGQASSRARSGRSERDAQQTTASALRAWRCTRHGASSRSAPWPSRPATDTSSQYMPAAGQVTAIAPSLSVLNVISSGASRYRVPPAMISTSRSFAGLPSSRKRNFAASPAYRSFGCCTGTSSMPVPAPASRRSACRPSRRSPRGAASARLRAWPHSRECSVAISAGVPRQRFGLPVFFPARHHHVFRDGDAIRAGLAQLEIEAASAFCPSARFCGATGWPSRRRDATARRSASRPG